MPTEVELKLRIAPEGARALARHPAVKAHKRGRARTTRVTSTYFDTADDALAAAGVALRLRRDGKAWVQTVKGPPDGTPAGGLAARPEFEWPVAGARLDPLRFAATPFRRALGKAERTGLAARFTTDIERTVIPLSFPDSTMAKLCIDVGHVRSDDGDPPATSPVHEIELELEAGDPQRLYELAHAIAADVPVSIETATKAERGYALRRPRPPEPVRADEVTLAPKDTAAGAFASIMQSCLWQIERNADGVATSTDPEWIHQMRIGVRRLREPAQLDVFVTSTLPDFADAVARGARPALRPTLDALASRTATARREARKHARAAVTSARFVRLVLAAGALRAQTGATRAGDLARDVARPLLKRRHQALIALGRNLVDAAPEERHAARLAAKKLRYATEFFASLFPRKKARAYRKSLAVLQEELGAWNDAATAARIAADVTGPESAAAAAFDGWAAARGASRRDALQASWSRFTEARPFW